MKKRSINCKKLVIVVFLVLSLILSKYSLVHASPGTTGIYLGSGNVCYGFGNFDYDIRGYVYYNSNNAYSLDLSSLVQWIYNYGLYEVDEVHFEAYDGNITNYTQSWRMIDAVTTGNNIRVEADWTMICATAGKSHVYDKNSDEHFACTGMYAGYGYGALGGWTSYWFPYTREDDFHF